jgi:hypothetical protein
MILRMVLIEIAALNPIDSVEIVLQVFFVLGVDRVHFPFCKFPGEKRGNEELSEAVEGAVEGVVADLEMIVGMVAGGKGVAEAAMTPDIVAVIALSWVFFGAQKEHMLQKMCDALAILRIAQRPHANGHGGGRFVQVGIG